jgi:hypothetical protein
LQGRKLSNDDDDDEKDLQIEELEEELSDKDAQLMEMDRDIALLEEQVAEKDKLLTTKLLQVRLFILLLLYLIIYNPRDISYTFLYYTIIFDY